MRWFKLHLVMLVVSSLCLQFARLSPGLSQPLLAVADMKWATFLIFTIATFARPDGSRTLWFLLFGVEFVMSLGGYFSTFKSVFLYTLIAITGIGTQLKVKHIAVGAGLSAVMLTLGLYWAAIKDDYRRFVSGNQAAQVVVVTQSEAIAKFFELIAEVTPEQLTEATGALASRFSEIDMFSAVVTHVPGVIHHEWGKLWIDAISRPFMPRILFPDKAVIDESELTKYYTGLGIAGMEEGTQVSMGYIAESYIDFGMIGMMGIIFIFGYFIGTAYRWLICHSKGGGLLGAGIASATFIQVTSIGFSSTKLVGGVVVSLLVAAIVFNFIVPHLGWVNKERP